MIDQLGLVLCVNNSWSGGTLSGQDIPDACVNRDCQIARDDGTAPDLVILFMGINDLGRGVDVGVFREDYQKTLQTIAKNHPAAFVCCINLPDRDSRIKARTVAFNSVIQDAVKEMGERFFVADLFSSKLKDDFYYDNTTDGLHPDEDGMGYIAEVVIEAIQKSCLSSLLITKARLRATELFSVLGGGYLSFSPIFAGYFAKCLDAFLLFESRKPFLGNGVYAVERPCQSTCYGGGGVGVVS